MPAEQAAGLDATLASGEGPLGSGVHEQQRAMAKEHPHMMSREREQWLLDHLSDMPLRCTVSPIEYGAEKIKKPVDYVAAKHQTITSLHKRALQLAWTLHDHEGDHAFLCGARDD